MKKTLIILTSCLLTIHANAQITLWKQLAKEAMADTLSADASDSDDIFIPESLDANVDSLLNSWHTKYNTRKNGDCVQNKMVESGDSVYAARLSQLPRIINMTYNSQVRQCIDLYVDRRRTIVEYMLGLTDYYFPMVEKALDENDLPLELKYLTVIESALNPTALSRAGASGLWQFMLPTGKIYGLEINSLIDERRDPVKATDAACKYLKDMYDIYKDWDLAIASYNCGPGNVNKAIRRSGGKTNFWEIYEYLPKETRSYVPLFIAANYVMNYYHEHNLCPIQTELPLSADTVMVSKYLHFDQISEVLKIDKEQLKALNPQYKKEIIPGNYKACSLLLPATYAYSFVNLQDTIYAHRSSEYLPTVANLEKKSGNSQERIIHKVKSGETLAKVANKYGVTTSQLRKWNGIKSKKKGLTKGKRLIIYVDNGGYSFAQNPSNEDSEKKEIASTVQSQSETKPEEANGTSNTSDDISYKKYKVKSGDTLHTISQRYEGVSAKDLMRMNKLNSSKLRIGQIIKVPVV